MKARTFYCEEFFLDKNGAESCALLLFRKLHSSLPVIFTVRLYVMQRRVLLSQFCPCVRLPDACIVTKRNNRLLIS